jgi:alkylhydroperoxidase family enzyme
MARYAPSVTPALNGFHEEIWSAVDPVLLELARLRIAMLLGDGVEGARRSPAAAAAGLDEAKIAELALWPSSPRFSEAERACLALTEQFVGDVSNVTQGDIDAVLAHLSPGQVYAFTAALLALDEHQRLSLAVRRVFDPVEEA